MGPETLDHSHEALQVIAANLLDPRSSTLVARPMKEPARGLMEDVHTTIVGSEMVEDKAARMRQQPRFIPGVIVAEMCHLHTRNHPGFAAATGQHHERRRGQLVAPHT
jgi:hypothetical protein